MSKSIYITRDGEWLSGEQVEIFMRSRAAKDRDLNIVDSTDYSNQNLIAKNPNARTVTVMQATDFETVGGNAYQAFRQYFSRQVTNQRNGRPIEPVPSLYVGLNPVSMRGAVAKSGYGAYAGTHWVAAEISLNLTIGDVAAHILAVDVPGLDTVDVAGLILNSGNTPAAVRLADSFGQDYTNQFLQGIAKGRRDLDGTERPTIDINAASVQNLSIRQQNDGSSCGLFTSDNAYQIMKNQPLKKGQSVAALRQELQAHLNEEYERKATNNDKKISAEEWKRKNPQTGQAHNPAGSGSGKGATNKPSNPSNPGAPAAPIALDNTGSSQHEGDDEVASQHQDTNKKATTVPTVSDVLKNLAIKGSNDKDQAPKGFTKEERETIKSELAKLKDSGLPRDIARGLICGYQNTYNELKKDKNLNGVNAVFDSITNFLGQDGEKPEQRTGLIGALDGLAAKDASEAIMGLFHMVKSILTAAAAVGMGVLQAIKANKTIVENQESVLKEESAVRRLRNQYDGLEYNAEKPAAKPSATERVMQERKNNNSSGINI